MGLDEIFTLIVGKGFTKTVIELVFVWPLPSVTVTEYVVNPVVAVEGLIEAVVAPPGLHEYFNCWSPVALAVNIRLEFLQTVSFGLALIVITEGTALIPVKSEKEVIPETVSVLVTVFIDPGNLCHGREPFHLPIKIFASVPLISEFTYVAATVALKPE
jgi:hypothetical protein